MTSRQKVLFDQESGEVRALSEDLDSVRALARASAGGGEEAAALATANEIASLLKEMDETDAALDHIEEQADTLNSKLDELLATFVTDQGMGGKVLQQALGVLGGTVADTEAALRALSVHELDGLNSNDDDDEEEEGEEEDEVAGTESKEK
jgi:hypothetical protein